ncbi:MAG: hypothetical protein IPF66_16615 [Holophagales bacterium]|nr:hypothetical protein [Holophagales bacterium]
MSSTSRGGLLSSALVAASIAVGPLSAAPGSLPEDHRTLATSTSYAGMEAFLSSVDGKGPVRVSVEGKTAEGRSLYLVHAAHRADAPFRIFFYAQQHGDEVSGKDALLYLIRDIVRDPSRLPRGRRPLGDADGEPDGAVQERAGTELAPT